MKLVEIAPPTRSDPLWKITIRTRAGRTWVVADHTLRGTIRVFRQARRAKCWDAPPSGANKEWDETK